MTSYDKAHQYLNSLLAFGIKLGLENTETLLKLLGNPEKKLKFVHLAGSNGKGSTGSMLAASLKNCGLKTAFYTSPFLVDFCERWRINGVNMSEERFGEIMEQIIAVDEKLQQTTGVKPTYFEVLTAVALVYFAEEKVDVVVWETGMGGRLDATNVVDPLLSIITNISLDHCQYLGETLPEVANEKAGIIKANRSVISAATQDEVIAVLEEHSKKKNAPLYLLDRDFSVLQEEMLDSGKQMPSRRIVFKDQEQEFEYQIALSGRHQIKNSMLAVKAMLELEKMGLIEDRQVALDGLAKAIWPGRLQELPSGLIIDGAHNPDATDQLMLSLNEVKPKNKWHFAIGILDDKDWRAVIDASLEHASSYSVLPIANVRSSKPDEVQAYLKVKGFEAPIIEVKDFMQQETFENTVLFGSLYLIGEVLTISFPDKDIPIELN